MASPDRPDDYLVWIVTNPPPDLQSFVAEHGGLYSAIPPEAWAQWDNACTAWEAARRDRLLGSHTWALPEIKQRKLK
jgi:hypothetical protein